MTNKQILDKFRRVLGFLYDSGKEDLYLRIFDMLEANPIEFTMDESQLLPKVFEEIDWSKVRLIHIQAERVA